ncbi:MAG: hypothetical protein M1436_10750, partial [Acidobacteria bacterium]|nr:hypothetical protein [Acidobacteriota bacterium]
NFHHIPVVGSRTPIWELDEMDKEPVAVGLRTDQREILTSKVLDGEPSGVTLVAGPSWWPLLTALGVGTIFIGYVYHPVFFAIGYVATAICAVFWFWPRRGGSLRAERRASI